MDDYAHMDTALIVDDDPVTRLLMKEALKHNNLTIFEAVSGEQALEMFPQALPDIVLLDVAMPGIDGFECCRRLRMFPKAKECAIVMVTASDRLEDIEKAFESGATDFMTKPLKWPLFSHRIRYILKANQTLQELSLNKNKLAKAQSIAHVVYWEWDYQSPFVECSDDLYKMLGIEDNLREFTYTSALQHIEPQDRPKYRRAVRKAIKNKQPYDIEYRVRRQDGKPQFIHERTDITSDYGHWRIVGTLHDITSRKQSEQEITYYAYYDTLTELPNRRLFIDQLESAVAAAKRHQQKLTLMFIDLDRFKKVNDTYGHHVGDELLCQAAHRIKECIRESDFVASSGRNNNVARLAGDEFTVLLSQVETVEDVADISERIIHKLSTPFTLGENQIYISASIGIAVFPDDGHNAQTLLQHADVAMYHAKESGRNNCQFFSESMNSYLKLRLELENDLRQAVATQQFELYYQPQINAESNEIFGFEALLRWHHPVKGLLTPDSFIDVAETTGLIIPIGDWVLDEACKQAKYWHDKFGKAYRISVNLSAVQFSRSYLPTRVRQTLEKSGLPAELLDLEVTETAVLKDLSETIPLLFSLKNLGVELAIDDFGTGYSSLNYLKNFPIDTLKIDKSFVDEIVFNKKDAAIAQTIVQLANNLELRTIAEGIETEAQQKMLLNMGCKLFQGYYYQPPCPAEQIEQLITR